MLLLHIVLDQIVTVIGYLAACLLIFKILGKPIAPLSVSGYMTWLVIIVLAYPFLYAMFGLYHSKRVLGRRREIGNVLSANAVGLLITIFALYLCKENHFSRTLLCSFAVFNSVFLVLERQLIRTIQWSARKNGLNQKYVLLVGYSRSAEGFIDRVNSNPRWGYQIRGILDDTMEFGTEYKGVKVIGTIRQLGEILAVSSHIDEIIITLSLEEYSKLSAVVRHCEKSGVHTKFVPDYNDIIPTQPYTEDLLGLPVVNIRHVPLMNPFNQVIKRITDLVVGTLALILFSPIMLFTVIMIKITSPGPILFKQERVGYKNKNFMMYKFRSMKVQTEEEEKKQWTTKNDPRVTRFGSLIRKTSIDELPQIFNVLKGDMSLVGPRPERPQFVEQFKEEIPRYMVKHQVRPGITGWAQVNGWRGDTSIRQRIEHDLYYIEHWTFMFDIRIMFLTIFKGFVNKNAY